MELVIIKGAEYPVETTVELNLSGRGLVDGDLAEIAKLVNLTNLELARNKLCDISPLANLKNLKKLNLCRNRVRDVTPLKDLIHLIRLDISHNKISDLTPLFELHNLENIRLEPNDITLDDYELFLSTMFYCTVEVEY